jgi:hypothetical protein
MSKFLEARILAQQFALDHSVKAQADLNAVNLKTVDQVTLQKEFERTLAIGEHVKPTVKFLPPPSGPMEVIKVVGIQITLQDLNDKKRTFKVAVNLCTRRAKGGAPSYNTI